MSHVSSPVRVLAAALAPVIVWGSAVLTATTQPPAFTTTPIAGFGIANAVAAGDMNGDGKMDLVGSIKATKTIAVALGNGAGGFQSIGHYLTLAAGPGEIALADMNGDTRLDVVVGTNSGFEILFGNGAGALSTFMGHGMPAPSGLKVGHFNGDTRPDVAVVSANQLRIFTNNGGGFLTQTFQAGAAASGRTAVKLALGKLNADSHLDVAVIATAGPFDGGNNMLAIFPGVGNGSVQTPTYKSFPNARQMQDVAIGDLDNDLDNDIVATAYGHELLNPSNPGVWVLKNEGGGAFNTPAIHHAAITGAAGLSLGDLNDDGFLDVAVAGVSNHSNNLYYYLNTGGGTFGPMAGGNFPYVNFNPGRTLMADFDGSGDGQLDIVIVNSSKEPAITFGGQPSDTTAPVITPTVNGMQSGGWYTSDVTVSWTVDDPESAETSSGCDTQTVTTDTSETTFTCSATSLGGSNSVSVTIKRDTTGPSIVSATANPSVLWPPNNKMRAVTVSVDASDAGSGLASCTITGVTDSEGTSQHEPDAEITGALTLNLRAERRGNGSGRSYGVQIACTDGAGNSSTAAATVAVPHDQGKGR